MSNRLLVVDDDRHSVLALRGCLEAADYKVTTAMTGTDALRSAALRPYECILLDLVLPDIPGIDVCTRLRQFTQTPIVVVTAQTTVDHKLELLDAGADHYLPKPFLAPELIATTRAAIRRGQPATQPGESTVAFGDVTIDLDARTITKAGEEVHLTPHEYGLLAELARHPNRVLTHTHLLHAVWGPAYDTETNYLWVTIRHLRLKLEATASNPQYILSHARVGYRLVTASRPSALTQSIASIP